MANLFDPATDTWTRRPDMNYAPLVPDGDDPADGRALVHGRSDMTTRRLHADPRGLRPGRQHIHRSSTNADLTIPSYPFVFQLPDGRVHRRPGRTRRKMPTYALDIGDADLVGGRPDGARRRQRRDVPARQVHEGRQLLPVAAAGQRRRQPSAATTYVLDTTQPTPAWQQTASMAYARTHLNLTVLPDGNVLATGGSTDIGGLNAGQRRLAAELWSPATQTWTTMASDADAADVPLDGVLLPGRAACWSPAAGDSTSPTTAATPRSTPRRTCSRAPRPTITSAPGDARVRQRLLRRHAGRGEHRLGRAGPQRRR